MNNTFILFEDRKAEIEFYYSIMLDIENNTGKIQTIDNSKFFRILKSNFLLMLYNLVEACVVSGMLEIYESLKQSQSGYNELIEEIQSLWSKYKIGEIYKSSGTRSSYEKGVREIIAQVITDEPVFLNRAALEISGNLDARRIKISVINIVSVMLLLMTMDALKRLKRNGKILPTETNPLEIVPAT